MAPRVNEWNGAVTKEGKIGGLMIERNVPRAPQTRERSGVT